MGIKLESSVIEVHCVSSLNIKLKITRYKFGSALEMLVRPAGATFLHALV